MLTALFVALFTILRIGVPLAILLTLGEVFRRYNQDPGNLRGA